MTEVDAVMHEGGASVPDCSPNRQTSNNSSTIVDSSLKDSEADHDDTVAASNDDTNKVSTNSKATANTTTTNSHQLAAEKPNEGVDVEKAGDGDTNIGDVSTTTVEPEDGEEDSQVTSSSTDVDAKQDKGSEGGEADEAIEKAQTPQSAASIDENSNSQQENDDQNSTKATSKDEPTPPADGAGESSQSCESFNNDDSQQSEDKQKLKSNEAKTEQNSVEEAVDDLKSTAGDVSPSFESAKVASPVADSKQGDNGGGELLHEPMEVDGPADGGDVDNEADPLGGASNDATTSGFESTKNGSANNAEKTAADSADNNGAIVELDDSEDEDNDDEEMNSNASHTAKQRSNGNDNSKSMCIDSDDPVVIGSDSESETNAKSTPAPSSAVSSTQKANATSTTTTSASSTHVIDDDDDDCVVVEDESSPMELTAGGGNSGELSKRKSMAIDAEMNSDDSQPPSKRQRNALAVNSPSTAPVQLTIKDARSLTPSDLSSNVRKSMGNDASASAIVYPVNITPAGNASIGPPKLAPLGGGTGTVGAIGIMPGLTNLTTNANLLPGLTDDMFVLEAPSFIVPYIYEKPPGDNLKGIVREIETKYELTKEDLTEADKSDEFDMMTEQNKGVRDQAAEQGGKKKKKKRGGDDVDDSWSEESDEDDDDEDDDDSDAGVRTKVLIKEASDDLAALKGAIKPASAVAQSTGTSATGVASSKPGQENYFESPLGKFFMDIGVGLVQEFVQSDLIRLQKRKMRKTLGQNTSDFERAITALSGNLEASKKKNAPYKFTMKRCEFCNFKSESALAMANHYETPHMNGPLYKCNFCTFEIRNATEIVYHMEAMHNIKARLIKPLPYHQCPNCGFEDNGKAKLARHQPVCAKKFRPDINLAPPNDWEAPAKIPRIKPRHGLVGTATAYQAMAAQAAAQKAALATIQQQQQQAQARSIQAAALAAQNAAKIRGRAPTMAKTGNPNGTATLLRGQNPVGPRAMATNVVLPNNYQMPGNQLLQANSLAGKKTSLPGQPSISITPLPRQGASLQTAAPSTSKMPPAGMKPGKNPNAAGNNKAQFVICEICDGYIKDLDQLRNHMQWMHEVKIHPKMIYNRPPLNCQKCQFRFFTDQGLERHLLGSHGLVTSSMQEAANNGKDAGRCPVCGRMYQWKLLNHVARDHHMTLKPAHLSYKCTVCTATFGMYKQFETHVYTAHSTVAKKAMDGKKNSAAPSSANAAASSAASSSNQRAAANDALLKPLKINDEITIIPQPASKPRITNMESHVID